MVLSSASSRLLSRFLPLVFVPLLLVGCSSGGTYNVNEGRLAQRYMPTERAVAHHPDSLRSLSMSEAEGKVQFELDRDYQALIEKWSCTFRSVGAGQSRHSSTYATLWSLELSLAALQPEMGILSLREERARELIEKRRDEYFDSIQIEVYWFLQRRRGSGIISGPWARTRLRVQDSTYRPIRTRHSPLREAFLSGSNTVLYRRNTLHFPRTVNGKDVLEGASEIRLEVRQIGTSSTERFTWSWKTSQTAKGANGAREAESSLLVSQGGDVIPRRRPSASE